MVGPAPVAAAPDSTPDDLTIQVTAFARLHELTTQLAGSIELQPALQGVLETIVDLHRAVLESGRQPTPLEMRLVDMCARYVAVAMETAKDRDVHRQLVSSLRERNLDLQEFAYAAAHDLQEPLRNVAIYSELLERRLGSSLDDESQQLFNYLTEGAKRMQALLSDLLAYTHLGGKEEAPAQVDAADVVRQVIETLQPSIEAAGATIEVKELPIVLAHESRLSQLFQNLLSNAIKYRRPDQPLEVVVNAEKQSGQWRFSVSDNGMGIDPAYHQQVFRIFKRLHSAAVSGTGIGLTICKRIVEQYGGSIWVESNGKNKGATFTFTIPTKG